MKNTLKLAVIGAVMFAALTTQAATGRVTAFSVTQGHPSGGGVTAMQVADGNVFRVASGSFPKIDWTAAGGDLGNPTFVHNMSVTIRGAKLGTSAIAMWMYDFISSRWVFVSTVNLPGVGLASTAIPVTNVPSRFVAFGGHFRMRFISTGPVTMIVDKISVTTS